MLEIDGVRHAIEQSGSFETADRVSDTYYDVIELATRPQLGGQDAAVLSRKRQFLEEKGAFVEAVLRRNAYMHETNMRSAYARTLDQVDEIMEQMG